MKYIKINTVISKALVVALMSISFLSCKKYLDQKPLASLVIPTTLNDLQAILDFHDRMNEESPILQVLVGDDYYLPTTTWQSRPIDDRMNYVWDPAATYINSWNLPYLTIYNANVVLDQISQISISEKDKDFSNSVRGSALFFRAFNFNQLAQLYCRPYSTTANADLGIVLRLTSNVNNPSVRSTVQQTYDQIISDLKEAADLLPDATLFPTRPNKAAAYGALARTYLSMRDYSNAGHYADLCLQKYNKLMSYDSLIAKGSPPIHRFNLETIFYNHPNIISTLSNSRAIIDSSLYQSYSNNDLRKSMFFKSISSGGVGFQGSYDGDYTIYASFDGITTDEQYLIRAESSARAGNTTTAMSDLNTLMVTRWKTGTFIPFVAADATDALNQIIGERRKELVYRGLRWSDLRRLNLEGANITLKRIINGTTYLLPPNDPRWVMLIPLQIISITNLPQNPR